MTEEVPIATRNAPDSQYKDWIDCRFCKYIFKDTWTRDRHIKAIHIPTEEAPNFKCSQCPKIYKRYDNLLAHKKAKHVNDPGVLTYRPSALTCSTGTQTVDLPIVVPDTPLDNIEKEKIGYVTSGIRKKISNPVLGTPSTSTLQTNGRSIKEVVATLRMASQIDHATKKMTQRRSGFVRKLQNPVTQLKLIEAKASFKPYDPTKRVAHRSLPYNKPTKNQGKEAQNMDLPCTPPSTSGPSPMDVIMEASGIIPEKSATPQAASPTPHQEAGPSKSSNIWHDLLMSSSSDSSSSDSENDSSSSSDSDSESEDEIYFNSKSEKLAWNQWILKNAKTSMD